MVILAVRPVPETVNCWMYGLADAVPAQAKMLPVAALFVITCARTFAAGKKQQRNSIMLVISKYLFTFRGLCSLRK